VIHRPAGSSELGSQGTGSPPSIFAQAAVPPARSTDGLLSRHARFYMTQLNRAIGASLSNRHGFLRCRVPTSGEGAAIRPRHDCDDQPERRTPNEHWGQKREA
jgi:hypothetical protein